MTHDEYVARSCTGKVSYVGRREARDNAQKLMHKYGGGKVVAYRCHVESGHLARRAPGIEGEPKARGVNQATRVASLTGLTYRETVLLGKLREVLRDSGLPQKEREAVVTVLLALELGRSTSVGPER